MKSTKRPTSPYTRITALWQERVKKELARRKIDQQELAKLIGASPGAVSNMLKPGAKTSRLVDAVNDELGIAPPVYVDEIDQELHELSNVLRERNRAVYDQIYQDIRRAIRELDPGSTKPNK